MRFLFTAVALAACFTGSAFALETAAGADTVNTSQVGINAKLDASNAIITSGVNQILQCNVQGKLYSSTTNTCIDPTEPLAQKIADCTTNKKFYNQVTGSCQTSAPDLTMQLNDTNSLLSNVLSCNANQQFYNQTTRACVGGGGGVIAHATVTCAFHAAQGQCSTPQCPSGYFVSGCSVGNGQTGYVDAAPSSNGCFCAGSHGGSGNITCYAFCVK